MKIIVISNTSDIEGEHLILHQLFEEGLQYFHIRKPKYSTPKLRNYLSKIDKKYRNRVIIHTHHELCIPYNLKGIHLTNRHLKTKFLQTWFMMKYIRYRRPDIQVTTSFHVINSLKRHNPDYAYVFLSPIFDSISKVGYKNTFSEATLKEGLAKTKYEVMAMGGVRYEVLDKVKDYGFHGFALLGGLWNSPDPVQEFRKIVDKCKLLESTPLSIAGFDPSGGAGLLADIKTFEQCGVYGLGVCTSVTFQNEIEFAGLEWVSLPSILSQVNILLKRYPVEVVKIGLVEDMEMLLEIVTALKKWNSEIKIIWDPILKSSTGFLFHDVIEKQFLEKILTQLYLLTPNRQEAIKMGDGESSAEEVATRLSKYCPVLLKGGHADDETKADDLLFVNSGPETITGERIYGKMKHGTGCVLSSAIASFVAHGFSLPESCQKAKGYVHSFISSAPDLLGWHHSIVFSETHA